MTAGDNRIVSVAYLTHVLPQGLDSNCSCDNAPVDQPHQNKSERLHSNYDDRDFIEVIHISLPSYILHYAGEM